MSIENSDRKQTKTITPFWVTFAAGGIAGTVGAVITCPLEVVKTRLQSSKFHNGPRGVVGGGMANGPMLSFAASNASPTAATASGGALNIAFINSALTRPVRLLAGHVSGTLAVLRSVAVEEGAGALWKGVGATIFGVLPSRAIYFSSYHQGKHLIADALHLSAGDARVHLSAAALAGMATCTATNPIWLIKTRMQLQSSVKGQSPKYASSIDCLKKVLAEEGVGGLYKGLAASYIGVAESTLQWVIYEHLKKDIVARRHRGDDQGSGSKWAEYFGAAAGAKFIAAVIAYPHEVLRTRMRETVGDGTPKYVSLRQSIACILREEGLGAFYGGMTAHLMRVVPNSAIMFFCYEFIVHTFDKLANSK